MLNASKQRRSNISQALQSISDDPAAALPEPQDLVVRPIRNDAELDAVYRLTHDAYLERGYCSPSADGRLIHYPHLDGIPETTVLVALLDGVIMGTNSWTLDGPRGLHVDSDFKSDCNAIRREDRRMAGSWRIATRHCCRHGQKVVMSLIERTVFDCLAAEVETAVFTFNPRHERLYQRLLNMTTVARRSASHGLSNAPAGFMRLDVESIPERYCANPVALQKASLP